MVPALVVGGRAFASRIVMQAKVPLLPWASVLKVQRYTADEFMSLLTRDYGCWFDIFLIGCPATVVIL